MLNERFNIGHELAHELIDADHSYLRHMMVSAIKLLRDRRESHGRRTAESLLSGYLAAIPEVHFSKNFETFKSDTLEWFEGEVGRAWEAEYVQATHKAETRVELFCDLVAVDFALERFFDRDTGMEDAIRALYVGAYHLRTISYFDWHCAEILLHRTRKDDLAVRNGRALAAMSVRNHCLRDHLLFVYQAHLYEVGADDANERTEALLHVLLNDQNRYYERILDPAARLLSFFSEEGRLQEYADAISARVPDLDQVELLDVSASLAIAEQTGWPFSLVEHFFEDVIS